VADIGAEITRLTTLRAELTRMLERSVAAPAATGMTSCTSPAPPGVMNLVTLFAHCMSYELTFKLAAGPMQSATRLTGNPRH
jgi:hypothetical protein